MRRPLYFAICAIGVAFLSLIFIISYASLRISKAQPIFRLPSFNTVASNDSIMNKSWSSNSSELIPCLLSPEGVPLFSLPSEPPCIRRYFFFNLDNRAINKTAEVNSTYIPLTVAANLYYVHSANKKWLAKNEEYRYLYYYAALSCHTDKLECTGPINRTTGKPVVLHPAWVALKVILDLLDNKMQTGDVGISIDTDVFIKADLNQTFYDAFHSVIPGLMNGSAPISLIRDGSYWKAVSAVSYPIDINSGIIMFVKNPACHAFFRALWASALVVSPLEKVKKQPYHFRKHWPWMQERLTWFASDRKWNHTLTYYPTGPGYDWQHEQPECFGIFCHMTSDKMNSITEGVTKMFVSALDCDEKEYSEFCSEHKHAVTQYDWLGRPNVLPYRPRRFNPSGGNVWNLARKILDADLQSEHVQVLPFR